VRPKVMVDLFEVLNLYIMFYSSLGLGSTIMITQFVEFVVFDTIRIRKREWPVAFELMVVLMRKVEKTPALDAALCAMLILADSACYTSIPPQREYSYT
jgi:hypothetical protein